jgi:hypothetical protein
LASGSCDSERAEMLFGGAPGILTLRVREVNVIVKKAISRSSALLRSRFRSFVTLSEKRSGSASINPACKSRTARSRSESSRSVSRASGEVADANSMRTIEHNFAEHPALLQVFVCGANFLQRKHSIDHRPQASGKDMAQHLSQFRHRAHVGTQKRELA